MRTAASSLCMMLIAGVGCGPAERASDPDANPEVRRLWTGEALDFATGDISPDGRHLSDINWDSGDLRLIDLRTGEATDLTGEGYGVGRYAWKSAFSRDGERIAVAWYRYDSDRHELRVMNRDGSRSRLLVPADGDWRSAEPLDWSPSGEQIAVALLRVDHTWQIGLVDVEDGAVHVVKDLGWPAPGGQQSYPRAGFSPDGARLAYDYPPQLEAQARDIYVVAVDGSGETALVAHSAADRFLGWLPDGTGILFHSDRGGSPGVWRLTVVDGLPVDEPELVRAGMRGVVPLGFTAEGYAYGRAVESPRVVVAPVEDDVDGGGGSPRSIDDPLGGEPMAADW